MTSLRKERKKTLCVQRSCVEKWNEPLLPFFVTNRVIFEYPTSYLLNADTLTRLLIRHLPTQNLEKMAYLTSLLHRESSVEELWSRAESLLGPVHCLVNNAGVTIVTMIMMTVIIMTFL